LRAGRWPGPSAAPHRGVRCAPACRRRGRARRIDRKRRSRLPHGGGALHALRGAAGACRAGGARNPFGRPVVRRLGLQARLPWEVLVLGSEPDAGLRRLRYTRGRRHISFVGRTSDISPLVADLPLFSARETAALHAKVRRLRSKWIARGTTGVTEFYSLGTACYLDFCCSENPDGDYLKGAPVA